MKEYLYEGLIRDFAWFMTHLLPANDKIKGCELLFPDTVFFKRGKPTVIIKTDREFCLVPINQANKLIL